MRKVILASILLCLAGAGAAFGARPYTKLDGGESRKCGRPDVAPDEIIAICSTILRMGIGTESTGVASPKKTADVVMYMAVAYRRKDQNDLAMQHFDFAQRVITEALAKFPDSAAMLLKTRCWIGAITGNRLDAALADCRQALVLQPDMADALDSLGFVLYRQGKYQEALNAYEAALAKRPDSPSTLYMRGMTKRKLGDEDGAAADIKDGTGTAFPYALAYSYYGVKPD